MTYENRHITYQKQGRERLDTYLSDLCDTTRSQINRWVKHGVVQVNGEVTKKNGVWLQEGDVVSLCFDDFETEVKPELSPEEIALLEQVVVVGETSDYVVIDKPSGLVTHPSRFITTEHDVSNTVSVAAWILRHDFSVWGVGEYANRPGIVHRLDKETSGLMVIAKNQKMFFHLKDQFKSRQTQKRYIALAHGILEEESGTLDFEIALGKDGKMAARPKVHQVNLHTIKTLQTGKDAVTEYEVMQRFANYTLILAKPKTGRTHQIRVHFFAYNHPLVGDPLYYNKKIQRARDKKLGRLFLHSHKLAFTDLKGELCEFESNLPPELTSFIDMLT